MRWIVGVGGARSRGALRFARWMAEATGANPRDACVPVHVLDWEHLRATLRVRHLDEVARAERAACEREIAGVFPGDDPPALRLAMALTVERGLEEARAASGADGIVIARAAPRGGRAAVRLGATARSLLRRPAAPVVVVPSDLGAGTVGAGPIVSLTALAEEDVAAARLARALADATGRELALVHAVAPAGAGAAGPAESADPLSSGEAALMRWAEEHGVRPDVTAVTEDDPVAAAVAFSAARRAPLVVAAAAPASPLDDWTPKRWRRIAALARQAVVVAPAGEGLRQAAGGERDARAPEPRPSP